MKKFKISIIIEREDQSIEDMEYNAQQYIKDDVGSDALYIEDIEEVEPVSDPDQPVPTTYNSSAIENLEYIENVVFQLKK